MTRPLRRLLVVANTDWFVYNFMLPFLELHARHAMGVFAATPAGPYAAELRRAGFEWVEVPMSRGRGTPGEAVRLRRRIRTIQAEVRPDVVHFVTAKCVLAGWLAHPGVDGPGVVNVLPGLGHAFASRSLLSVFDRWAIRGGVRRAAALPNAVTVFHQSADRAAILAGWPVPADRSRLIPGWGVDLAKFDGRSRRSNPPIVALIGRMLWTKGVGEFVEASRLVRGALRSRFVLVGAPDEGNPASIPVAQLEAWSREGVVEWWGQRADVPGILRQTSVCVLPTRYAEGVPQTLLEAAAMRVPLVASDVAGCREVVVPGETGLLVPPGEVESLASAIRRILTRSDEARQLGARARAFVSRRFSVRRLYEAYLDVYRTLGFAVPPATGQERRSRPHPVRMKRQSRTTRGGRT